jgi:hypothetical protein
MSPPLSARIVLVLGLVGLLVTVINQLQAPHLDPSLERASVLASLLSVVLMVNAALWQRVVPEAAVRAPLEGEEGCELADDCLPKDLVQELGWGSAMLLSATPAATLLLHDGRRTVLRRGLLPRDAEPRHAPGSGDAPLSPEPFIPGAICSQASRRQRAISLVDLKPYPGRGEFDSLLPGLPAVVVQPVGPSGVLLLGGWSARCFSQADLRWIEGWARKLSTQWAPAWQAPGDDLDSAGAPAPA